MNYSRRSLLATLALPVLAAPSIGKFQHDPVAKDTWSLTYRFEPFEVDSSGAHPTTAELALAAYRMEKRLEAGGYSVRRVQIQGSGSKGRVQLEIEAGPGAESTDTMRRKLQAARRLQLSEVATADNREYALAKELRRLTSWRKLNPTAPLAAFHDLPRDQGGPHPGLKWVPLADSLRKSGSGYIPSQTLGQEALAVRIQDVLRPASDPLQSWDFDTEDLGALSPGFDSQGLPAVNFEMRKDRKAAFGNFTESIVDRQLALILDGEILSTPIVQCRLPGGGILTNGPGSFTPQEMHALIEGLRHPLPARPILLTEEFRN